MPPAYPTDPLTGYPRVVRAAIDARAPLALLQGLVANLARYAEWLSMHASFRSAPPEVASAGDTFAEQVTLMGIPADIAWTVAEAGEGSTVLTGTGPMDLTIALRVAVADGEDAGTVRVSVDAGIGGDPAEGPLGATVAASVEEALRESVARLAALAESLAADPAEAAGRVPDRPWHRNGPPELP